MTKRLLAVAFASALLAAAGCATSTRTASAQPTPSIGGDNVDPSSARNNTDPAFADPYDPRNPSGPPAWAAAQQEAAREQQMANGPARTGTGSSSQQP